MGDLLFLHTIAARLAAARSPLITVERKDGLSDLHRARYGLTHLGGEVAGCRQDAVRLNGIDEWRGGVHLHGHDRSPWRWDADRETLLS